MSKPGTFAEGSVEDYIGSSSYSEETKDPELYNNIDRTVLGLNTELSKEKQCYICDKKFGLTIRHHNCRFCGKSVCDDHSQKRRTINNSKELHRICDKCEKLQIADEVRKELKDQLARLQDQFESIKTENEHLHQENLNKIENAKTLEQDLKRAEVQQVEREAELQRVLKAEQDKGLKAKAAVQCIQKEFEDAQASETKLADKCRATEDELSRLRNQLEEILEKKEDLVSQASNLSIKLKSSLLLEEVQKILCERCQRRINEFYRIDNGDGPEEESNYSIPTFIRQSSIVGRKDS